ncbi:MAG TPA: formylglycine-generating enzyme family protein [Pirellulales bacterium]|nr:formylglycine-generating enzyme family protein [Pirellulales bacterium]
MAGVIAVAIWQTEPSAAEGKVPQLNKTAAPAATPAGMAWIPGGRFWMGDGEFPDARVEHLVDIDGFWLDTHEVTNTQFAEFVAATGYKTVAEQPLDPKEFPNVPPEDLKPGSIVFTPPPGEVSLDNHFAWWSYVPGANWRHPEGPESSIDAHGNHPVVQIAWHDALAYAKWAGKRLPTEAEWELAARGGLDRQPYCWGSSLRDGASWRSNIWQGRFPHQNSAGDGFRGTAPVGTYAANGYGLFDMSGNVWEWCSDWYRPDYYLHSPAKNPQGPDSSFDPQEPDQLKRVQRGGSFLCSDLYCKRYVPGARGKGEPSSAAGHIGFRCARSTNPE